jgi:DNA-binding SARP family transcriptional activator
MEFGVLGPVEVWADGQAIDAGHARQRAVLAVLLLDAGRPVPTEVLIDRVWGEGPPRSVRNVLSGYVTRLRALAASGQDPGVCLSRRTGGYLLRAGAEKVDLSRFRRLVADAAAAGDDERAGAALGEATGLWRGPALGGLSSPWLNAMRATLELQRISAVLDLNDIRLRRGEHGALVSDLAAQTAESPADERLIGQLMLALYRCGQRAEALRWFERTRHYLADELGADPGPPLRTLHQQILRADPSLAAPRPAMRVAAPVPREPPADVPTFTGRAADSLALYQPPGNRLGQAKIHRSLGALAERQGRCADALGHAEQALRLYQAIGDKASEAEALNAVGWCHGLHGDYQQARAFCRQALTLSAEIGHRWVEGAAWDSLAYAERQLGNLAEAADCYQRALSRYREAGFRFAEADTLTRLGDVRQAAGELAQAREAWQEARAILEDLQHGHAGQVRAKLARPSGHAPPNPPA